MPSEPRRAPRNKGQKPNLRIEDRFADEARFIKSWLDNPLLTGAVTPSGPALAQMMARAIDPSMPGPIIELGPGTGVITKALLERGIEAERLILVEFDASFCRLLAERFPGVHVVQGDAYHLSTTLAGRLDAPAAAIVSSLPLMTKPERVRLALLAEGFDLMAPDGPFVQFTYSVNSPIPRKTSLAFEAEASPRIWLNVPPARVWVYRRAGEGETNVGVFRQLKAEKSRRGLKVDLPFLPKFSDLDKLCL